MALTLRDLQYGDVFELSDDPAAKYMAIGRRFFGVSGEYLAVLFLQDEDPDDLPIGDLALDIENRTVTRLDTPSTIRP